MIAKFEILYEKFNNPDEDDDDQTQVKTEKGQVFDILKKAREQSGDGVNDVPNAILAMFGSY